MKIPTVLTDFIAFVNGDSYSGKINKAVLPEIVAKTVEKNITGYAAAMEVATGRLEKMESEIVCDSFLSAEIFPLIGNNKGKETPVVIRGSLRNGSEDVPIKVVMQGLWKSAKLTDFEMDAETSNSFKVVLERFSVEINNQEQVYINLSTYDIRLGGVSITDQIKSNLGL